MRIEHGMPEGDVVRDVTHINPDHIVQLLRSKNNRYYIIYTHINPDHIVQLLRSKNDRYYIIYRRNLMNVKTLRLQISKDIANKILEMPDAQAYDHIMRRISLAEGDL